MPPTSPTICEKLSSAIAPFDEKIVNDLASLNTGALGPVKLFTGIYPKNPRLPLSIFIAPFIVNALPSSVSFALKLIAPPEIIVPFIDVPVPTFTAPVTNQNTLLALAPFFNIILEFGLVFNAKTGGDAGILKIKTALGSPCASNVKLKFNDVAPGKRYVPALSVESFPNIGFVIDESGIAALKKLYAKSKSPAQVLLAPSPSCITPFTLPKPVLEPEFEPTLPVKWVRYFAGSVVPTFVTAPTVVKRTKFAAVPKLGACPKSIFGKANKTTAIINSRKVVFMILKVLSVK